MLNPELQLSHQANDDLGEPSHTSYVTDNDKIFVADCDLGKGIFAIRDFERGEVILIFTGPVISYSRAVAKGDRESHPLQIGVDRYLDLEEPGVLTNHSCEPNAGILNDMILIAIRPIARGEEIRFDYSTTMSQETWTLECRCRAASCRGIVRNFEELPQQLQRRYLALGIVQNFIRSQFETRNTE